MASDFSQQEKRELMEFLKTHPIPDDYDPGYIDDSRTPEAENTALAHMIKIALEDDQHGEG